MMYQGEFTEEQPEHKMVISAYAENDIQLVLIDEKSYTEDKWENIDSAMYDACMNYPEADPPSFDSIQAQFNKGA